MHYLPSKTKTMQELVFLSGYLEIVEAWEKAKKLRPEIGTGRLYTLEELEEYND